MNLDVGALPWLAAGAFVLVVALIAGANWPMHFDVSGQARGDPNGSWVVAGGASLSFLSVAFVAARGSPLQLNVVIFGRRVNVSLHGLVRRVTRPVPHRVKSASRRLWQPVDVLGLALKLLEERRHLRLRYLVIDLDYGFRDPLLTGRLVGALSALSGVLPAFVELRQRPRWDLEDGWAAVVDGRAVVRPWLILLDVAVYVVKRLGSRRAPVRETPANEESLTERPSEVG